MATTRPDASDTTGTLRETSGATVPVTTSSETEGRAVAESSGNFSGWSTVNRVASPAETTLGGGGSPAPVSPCALLHPARVSSEMRSRPTSKLLVCIRKFISVTASYQRLEFDHDASADGRLAAAQIGEPDAAGSTAGRLRRCQVVRAGRCAAAADELSGSAVIAARRRDSVATRKVRHVRVTIANLRPPGDVLLGHVVQGHR